MSIHRKIAQAREARGISQSDLARELGVKPQTVQQWESGRTAPARRNHDKLVEALGLQSVAELFAQGDDEDRIVVELAAREPGDSPRVVRGPTPIGSIDVQRLAVRASAGTGAIRPEHDVVVGSMQVSVEWLKRHIHCTRPSALRTITAYGNSMAPTFYDGDLVLIDTGVNLIDVDGVYVVAIDGELFIKRFERRPREHELWMHSDNKAAYPEPSKFSREDGRQLEVLGKAVWIWSGKKPD